jgi:cytoskeletal protein CcmA (bactofilin family)
MAEVRIKEMDEHEIDTILAEDIDFEGHLTFKKPLMIKGKFKGEIKSTGSLYIGEKALVEAKTEAAVISSKGKHKGDIIGHSRVELYSTAQVDGDITTPDFIMESGSKFNGYCNMSGAPRKDTAQARPQGQPPQQVPPQAPHAPQPAPAQGHGPQQPTAPQSPGPQAQAQQQPGQQAQQQQRPTTPTNGQGGQQK